MIDHEPQPLAIEHSAPDRGVITMHAPTDSSWGWALIALGASGSWFAHNFYGVCSLAIMLAGLYLNYRNGETGREKYREQLYREWDATRHQTNVRKINNNSNHA